jgi:hypothetical protein
MVMDGLSFFSRTPSVALIMPAPIKTTSGELVFEDFLVFITKKRNMVRRPKPGKVQITVR